MSLFLSFLGINLFALHFVFVSCCTVQQKSPLDEKTHQHPRRGFRVESSLTHTHRENLSELLIFRSFSTRLYSDESFTPTHTHTLSHRSRFLRLTESSKLVEWKSRRGMMRSTQTGVHSESERKGTRVRRSLSIHFLLSLQVKEDEGTTDSEAFFFFCLSFRCKYFCYSSVAVNCSSSEIERARWGYLFVLCKHKSMALAKQIVGDSWTRTKFKFNSYSSPPALSCSLLSRAIAPKCVCTFCT